MTRVSVLIEGRNFYAGCKRWAREHDVDFVGLKRLIAEQTNGTISTQPIYYMGVDQNGHLPLESSARIDDAIVRLKAADYTVRTFPLRVRTTHCQECGEDGDEIIEKQVDSAIAVDAMKLIHAGETDLFVLITSDSAHLPLVQAIRAAGKKVWIVAWQLSAVSNSMTEAVDNVLVLEHHRQKILTSLPVAVPSKATAADFLNALASAEQQFARGYVGLHHFLKHWKDDRIPRSVVDRSGMLNELIANGAVIQYTAPDGNAAVKRALTR